MADTNEVDHPPTTKSKQEKTNEKSNNGNGPFDHPVYKKLAVLNGDVNKMAKAQLVEELVKLRLDTRGLKDVLKKRLKNYYKRKNLASAKVNSGPRPLRYEYLIVIDFEATCDQRTENYPHEIIEFPAVLLGTVDRTTVDEFHSFVKPSSNPVLSAFCTELTGITQEQVNLAPSFPEVLEKFEKWIEDHQLQRFAIVTDGPWDMSRFMYLQCRASGIAFPSWARRWINIRKAFCNSYRTNKASVLRMLESFGLAFEGQQHSGIADARNIARIVVQMLDDGCSLNVNEKMNPRQLESVGRRSAEVFPVAKDCPTDDEDADDDKETTDDPTSSDSRSAVDETGDHLGDDLRRNVDSLPIESGNSTNHSDAGEKKTTTTTSEVDDCADLLRYVALQSS